MRIIRILIFVLSSINIAFAQTSVSSQPDLKMLEEKFQRSFIANHSRADSISNITHQPLRFEGENGEVAEFSRFAENGEMLFNKTNNLGSGRTISTNKVWPGGTTGTSLTGAGLNGRLGVWDGGGVLTSHQEFNGRVTQIDAVSGTLLHSTHVAGTMVAAGVYANAIGMAYQATLSAYDWNNDVSEMTNAGAAGMLLSNHSYSTICGWYDNTALGRWEWYGISSISTTKDYKYGFYDQQAADWDNVAYSNPDYLICIAAGNDRGAYLQGSTWYVRDANYNWVQGSGTIPSSVGPYDCVSPTATAKNILTVGAVNKIGNSNTNNGWTQISDVVMSSFSAWGPTDDGRIKPDVVAAGVNITSTSNASNSSYTALSGTSMATPAVCGSLLLVQQQYNSLKGKFMRAATLKGIAIHTADEAGNAGPDYVYGWGLLNTSKAVKLISDSILNQVQERTLTNGATYTQSISSDGTAPLRITISWTDIPATPLSPTLNDPTPRLINDLDVRLKRVSDNAVFMPYVLNPALPSSAATTGDNTKDNLEQIYLPLPVAGTYIVSVSHKGALSSPQAYSLIISGLSGPPKAIFSKSSGLICAGQTVTYTDYSLGSPTSRTWFFAGGTPSSSAAASVNVTYNFPGKFPVALKVSNSAGSDSTYLPNAVTVGGLSLPFTETFEPASPTLSSWTKSTPVNDTAWKIVTVAGTLPGNHAYCMPFFTYAGSTGQRDGLISPAISLSGLSSANISFQHAYVRRNTTSTDSLIVYISTDCGNSWTRLLSKGENGSGSFATFGGSFTQYFYASSFAPVSGVDWCTGARGAPCQNIDLSSYVGMSNIKIKFESYNNFGNNLYLDNVNITGTLIKPVANFTVSKTTACAGEPISFADSSQNIVTNWQWTFTGATTPFSIIQNPSGIIYNVPGIYPVKLIVTNSGGSDSIIKTNYITILESPNVPTISVNRAPVICSGDSLILTCDSTGTGYRWLNNGVIIPGAVSKTLVVYSGGSFQVKTSNANGCETVSPVTNVIYQPPIPTPTFTSTITGTSFCTGGMAQFTSSAAYGNHWYKNGMTNSADTNIVYSTSDSGTYSLKVVLNGCSSNMSSTKSYGLLPKPASITSISGNTNSHYNNTETYSVVLTAGSACTWSITGGTQISGGTTNSIMVKWNVVSSGTVQARETSTTTGCRGDAATLLVSLTPNVGIADVEPLTGFKIYPNPANALINIEFESSVKQNIQVNLVNMIGQKIFTENIPAFSGQYKRNISANELRKGVYFIEVKSENGNKQMKVMIE